MESSKAGQQGFAWVQIWLVFEIVEALGFGQDLCMRVMRQELDGWLRAFSRAVRDRDFASGKCLFDAGVVSFGTVCFRADTLDELQANQWQFIWPNTRDFDFEYSEAATLVERDQAVIVAGWSSTGFKGDGAPFQRRGRATIVLRRQLSGWKAVHTHFSLEPALKP